MFIFPITEWTTCSFLRGPQRKMRSPGTTFEAREVAGSAKHKQSKRVRDCRWRSVGLYSLFSHEDKESLFRHNERKKSVNEDLSLLIKMSSQTHTVHLWCPELCLRLAQHGSVIVQHWKMVIISAAARGQTRFRLNRKLTRTEHPWMCVCRGRKRRKKTITSGCLQSSFLYYCVVPTKETPCPSFVRLQGATISLWKGRKYDFTGRFFAGRAEVLGGVTAHLMCSVLQR